METEIITIIDNGQRSTHFNYGRNDYTLCGLDNMGDSFIGLSIAKRHNKKVDCKECIRIVEYCKSIKKSQYK